MALPPVARNFNVVNVYDNCPPFKQREAAQFYANTGLTPVCQPGSNAVLSGV
jgi:hypothetical protein